MLASVLEKPRRMVEAAMPMFPTRIMGRLPTRSGS